MRYLLVSVFLLFPIFACAQDKKPGDEMIEKYLAAETDKVSAKFLDGAKTIDEWKQKRPRLYQEYMDMLGLWPIPEKTALQATRTGEVEAHGAVVEKIHFQSKPGHYVTANLYRPKKPGGAKRKKLPAIVYVCGHSWKGRDGNKTAFQDHGFWFANNGYVCIILDTLQLGEIPGVHHGTYGRPWAHAKMWGETDAEKLRNHNRFWWHSIGYSPAAVECWNGIRAIDYLCTRNDVDPDKIGVTGISGGGAATFWIAAADDRVKVAVPVSGMSDLEFYVKNKGVNGHCDCMFMYNTFQWDWTTIAALVAPRPMLFANSDKDPIFPMDANRRIFAKLQKIYGMYDAEKAVREYVSVGGHDYRPDLRKAIFHFFNLHLKRQPTPLVEDSAKYTPLEGRKLRVFPTDDDLPKDAINHRIDELFIPAAKVALPEKGKFADWKKEMIAKIRRASFHRDPEKFPDPTNSNVSTSEGITTWYLTTEQGISVTIYRGPSKEKDPQTLFEEHQKPKAVLVGVSQKFGNPKWSAEYVRDCGEVLRLSWDDARQGWETRSPPNYVARSHALLGRTVDEGKVRDASLVVRTFWGNDLRKDKTWKVVGREENGIIAAYAALFEPSIKEVVVIDPPKSHKEGPHFINVLRVLDIPEALGLLAPTPLTIVGGDQKAFERTAEIYQLAGAADKLKRK